MWKFKFITLLLIVIGGKCQEYDDPVITTKFGSIKGGHKYTYSGRTVDSFLGLPYAKAPIKELRFKDPENYTETWDGTKTFIENKTHCIQIDYKDAISGSEDCLYLNIFRPSPAPFNKDVIYNATTKFPVLVFIRGGSFNMGNTNSDDFSPKYLLNQNIILVTFNYRLNFLGFYSTGSKASPGNYGLKDMVAVLKWVKENIEKFGGDPGSVTLFGNSAGAAAIHHLALSPLTKGLFHKIITMSGTALAPWAYHSQQHIIKSSIQLAEKAGCHDVKSDGNSKKENNETDMEKMVACMRNKTATELLHLTKNLTVWKYSPNCIFGPTWEETTPNAIVINSPRKSIENGTFHNIPWMVGVTSEEGYGLGIYDEDDLKYISENFVRLGPEILEYQEVVKDRSNFTQFLIDYYFKGNITGNYKINMTKLLGDAGIYWPVYETLQKQANTTKSKIYAYHFGYEGTFSVMGNKNRPPGVAHMDDVNYLFPFLEKKVENKNLTKSVNDTNMINIMTKLFATFAKTGEPNFLEITKATEWKPYNDDKKFMILGKGKALAFSMEDVFPKQTMEFWASMMNNVTNGTIEETIPHKKSSASFPHDKSALFTCLLLFLGLYYV